MTKYGELIAALHAWADDPRGADDCIHGRRLLAAWQSATFRDTAIMPTDRELVADMAATIAAAMVHRMPLSAVDVNAVVDVAISLLAAVEEKVP